VGWVEVGTVNDDLIRSIQLREHCRDENQETGMMAQ
jgi:hypothetical protein